MKRYLPIIFVLITLVAVNSSIFKQQQLIATGKVIFVELQPVDPRSLIQGDYMQLRYQLNLESNQQKGTEEIVNAKLSLLDYRLVVTLDSQSRVIASSFVMPQQLADNQHLLIVKINSASSWEQDFYPASNSFLFAEGLAYCYDKARYAELRVNSSGKPLLYRLTDDQQKPLDCESKQRDKTEDLSGLFEDW